MPENSLNVDPVEHLRWSRSEESAEFFVDEDKLRRIFYFLAAGGVILLALLVAGLWRLGRAAFTPPTFVGISHGLIFSGAPQPLASVRERDFDRQLADTIEVLFSRTEKGLPPAIAEFCAADVVRQIDQAYRDQALKYPAGYVQTMTVLESRVLETRQGFRRMRYAGRLSSRSASAAQTSTVFLDCTFVIGPRTPLNAAGWRLTRVDALARDAFYQSEHEQQVRRALDLPPTATSTKTKSP